MELICVVGHRTLLLCMFCPRGGEKLFCKCLTGFIVFVHCTEIYFASAAATIV